MTATRALGPAAGPVPLVRAPDPTLLEALAAPAAAARDAFGRMLPGAMALRQTAGLGPAAQRRVMAERGALVAAIQGRDAFDQRLQHIEAMLARLPELGPADAAATERMAAAQLAGLAAHLCDLAEAAARAAHAIAALAQEPDGADAAPLAARMPETAGGAAGLARAAEALTEIATGITQRVQALPSESGIDLGWIARLYTMDAERDIHARVLRG